LPASHSWLSRWLADTLISHSHIELMPAPITLADTYLATDIDSHCISITESAFIRYFHFRYCDIVLQLRMSFLRWPAGQPRGQLASQPWMKAIALITH